MCLLTWKDPNVLIQPDHKNHLGYLLKLIQIPGLCMCWAPGVYVFRLSLGGKFGKVLKPILRHKEPIRQNCPHEGPGGFLVPGHLPFLSSGALLSDLWAMCPIGRSSLLLPSSLTLELGIYTFFFPRVLRLIFMREQQEVTQIMTMQEVQRLGKWGHGLGPQKTVWRLSLRCYLGDLAERLSS